MLPPTLTVKISSEDAGAIALTPVVAQTMTPTELTKVVLAVTGKDSARVEEVLRRGTIVQGASRFRWDPLQPSEEEVSKLLARFPEPDPSRQFDPEACRGVHLASPNSLISLTREDAAKRRWFRRRSLWDEILATAGRPVYVEYSYRDDADLYRSVLSRAAAEHLRDAARLAVFSKTAQQLRASNVQRIDFSVTRPAEVR